MYCKIKLTNGKEVEADITDQMLNHIFTEQEEGRTVPLYATTYQKSKYGDAKIGDILSVKITPKE